MAGVAGENDGEFEIVYVDGNPFKVTTDVTKGRVIVESLCEYDDSKLVISENGESFATVYNKEKDDFVNYTINIDNLSEEAVDLEIIDDSGNVVEEIKSYEELIGDVYRGQSAAAAGVTVVTGISVSTLLAATFAAAACIAVESVIYYGAKAAIQAISGDKDLKSQYFRAYIHEKNVFINNFPISRENAISRIIRGDSIYTFYQTEAKRITLASGMGCSKPDISNLEGKIRFYHFHTLKKHGEHIFYGMPIIK
jgi:hypothetical protein